MKVFRNKSDYRDVCIQYTDLEFLKKQAAYRNDMPSEVKAKIERMEAIKEVASYDTFVSFQSEEAIAYFKSLSFIANYDDYKNKTRKEIQRIVQERYSTFKTIEDEHFINSIYLINRINEGASKLQLPTPKKEEDLVKKESISKKIKQLFSKKENKY